MDNKEDIGVYKKRMNGLETVFAKKKEHREFKANKLAIGLRFLLGD